MVVGDLIEETDLVVIGGGPGGYVAAFRAADLGLQVTLVDEATVLGGVCLREGCIPSKALLHVAHLIEHAADAETYGVKFGAPAIDVPRIRAWKQSVVDKLCNGVNLLANKRGVRVIVGRAVFDDSRTVQITGGTPCRIRFEHAIIASGSRNRLLPESVLPAGTYIDSTGALDLADVPKSLLVVGGGYIGMELGQVYAALGTQVTVVEMLDRVVPGADADLARVLIARLKKQFAAIRTGTQLAGAKQTKAGIEVTFNVGGKKETGTFDRVLLSIGRQPNSDKLQLEKTKVKLTPQGFIEINERCQTAEPHIYAIGDVAGNPMLAHKASREGIVAAENCAGHDAVFDQRAIPAVVYTSPELAWCGMTEAEAQAKGVPVKIGKFNWGASGKAIAIGHPEGLTKIIADADGRRVLGVGIVGVGAGDLIAEAVLAMEMGAEAADLAATIHPHPATSETLMEAAESVLGKAIHALQR